MNVKRFIFGEPSPDKDDPKYKERYEREVAAGRRFGDRIGLSWLSGQIQRMAEAHKVGFLVVVFGVVLVLFGINAFNLYQSYHYMQDASHPSALEVRDSVIQEVVRNR